MTNIHSTATHRSVDVLKGGISRATAAGASIIQVRTREAMRAAEALRRIILVDLTSPYTEWGQATGNRTFTAENLTDNTVKGTEIGFVEALIDPMTKLRDKSSALNRSAADNTMHYFAFVDPAPHMRENSYVLDLLRNYATILPASNAVLIFVTEEAPLEQDVQNMCVVAELPTPNAEELQEVLRNIVTHATQDENSAAFPEGVSLDDEAFERMSLLGLGMALAEFEQYVSLAVLDAAEDPEVQSLGEDALSKGIGAGKVEVLRSTDILEFMESGDLDGVGGMRNLKRWIGQRKACYTPEAREFGIEFPKGISLVGVPGAGKSLAAKAVAGAFGIPLIRLDFARIFNKYVGESEKFLRAALKMVERMAPCVLMVDEIDKGLGGVTGGQDSGVGMRVLGTYLTWLNDLKIPIFNVVTANRVDGLPPELLRRGRFDQIFSVTLPVDSERLEVFQIHFAKRGRDFNDFNAAQRAQLLAATEGFVPAEIEQVVKDALVVAFSEGEQLAVKHVLQACQETIPLSKSNAEAIQAIVTWAANNAISVSADVPSTANEPRGASGRRLVVPTRAARAPAKPARK